MWETIQPYEPVIRLSAFLGVFAVMALWEVAALVKLWCRATASKTIKLLAGGNLSLYLNITKCNTTIKILGVYNTYLKMNIS